MPTARASRLARTCNNVPPSGTDLYREAGTNTQPPVGPHGSAILTTNRGIAEWGAIFEDTTVAVAILDWLLHYATVLQIDTDSYRMRNHRARLAQLRAGLANAQDPN